MTVVLAPPYLSVTKPAAGGRRSLDTEGFPTNVASTAGRLAADERFAEFRDTPGTSGEVATLSPSGPWKGFSRGSWRDAGLMNRDGRPAACAGEPAQTNLGPKRGQKVEDEHPAVAPGPRS